MKSTGWRNGAARVLAGCLTVWACGVRAESAARPPFPYVEAKAWHILPGTHNNESGYFSLCEGRNGRIYVGTAKYNENAYLVEFDPATEKQRVVIDVHSLCGQTEAGQAAQAKIHTRNDVGASGTIYCGSMHGHHLGPDADTGYPGGYLMTYDPSTEKGECLGIPSPREGVIDVRADESRGILYVVTIDRGKWFRFDKASGKTTELGPTLLPFATTLLDAKGRAHALTKDYHLATYDPDEDTLQVRPIFVGGQRWETKASIPVWVGNAGGDTAYLIMMSDPTLLRVDLLSDTKDKVAATNLGKMIEGRGPDSRCGLAMGADGNVYALIRVENDTGFGGQKLHHLLRHNVAAKKNEDLGVLAVKNPDFFPWQTAAGNPQPFSHGYHRLPDGTLTPLWHHMALIAAHDNTLYATVIYPFTLLKIDQTELSGHAAASVTGRPPLPDSVRK